MSDDWRLHDENGDIVDEEIFREEKKEFVSSTSAAILALDISSIMLTVCLFVRLSMYFLDSLGWILYWIANNIK